MAIGGCSADVTRFDEPAFGLTDSDNPNASRGAGGFKPIFPTTATAQAPPVSAPSTRQTPAEGRPSFSSSGRVETAALSEVSRPAARATRVYNRPPDRERPQEKRPQETWGGRDNGASAIRETITIVRGDTLYGLARRHDVTVQALMSENGLTSTVLRPGQTLQLPAGVRAQASTPSRRQTSRPTTFQPQDAPASWNGRYEVVSGDSLYTIARRHDVKVAALRRYNGIADPRRLRPGQILKVPGSGAGPTVANDTSERRAPVTSGPGRFEEFRPGQRRIIAAPQSAPATPDQPAILNNSRRRVAALDRRSGGTVSDAPRGPTSVKTLKVNKPAIAGDDAGRLRWPVTGRIISRFGPRSDGTHNDGVNVAVPPGTDVKAAEDGVVAYAGSELKGYGKLILVRHDNGWVTAYAHNSDLLVKRGDKVKRGQTIAKSGKTGEVDTPQVHFELRQGAKPVDPVPYLKRT